MNYLNIRVFGVMGLIALGCAVALAAETKKPEKPGMTEAGILKGIKGPAGYDVTVFAMPPNIGYPTAIATGPKGELYVAIDENGSLDNKPNRGRVVRCTDTDGDGRADEFKTFAVMDSPRGVFFENNVLYVLHPPDITAFHDDNGDGVSDRTETLVKGLGFDLKFRGADHTTNGFRVGIDGWMYIAMGDYGAIKATGKDGTIVQFHGGAVMRVRLDGSGLENYSFHQRNIYDVAVSPTLDVFTRDNTNDGGGWDVRLSHIIPTGEYGYPSLYKSFGDEIVKPLADYGGGSPVGALYLDEPGLKNGLYTVEWGRNGIMHHPLEESGAGFKAKQETWMELQRPTDMDVDGAGRIFVSSWINGNFNYAGPNVGFVARVSRKGATAIALPDFKKAGEDELVKILGGGSAVNRLYAQREIIRRGEKVNIAAIVKLAETSESPAARTAAVFTLKQMLAGKSTAMLEKLAVQSGTKEIALRALADISGDTTIPADVFVKGLSDANPRVRLMAAWGLARLNKKESAAALLPLVADGDALVSHVAINSLRTLKAGEVCLKAVDSSTPNLIPGALRVLQAIHDVKTVDELIAKLGTIQDAGQRAMILRTLCRLHFKEADWDGKWWGTRPDNTGPYYKTATWAGTARVEAALKSALTTEKPEVIRGLLVELQKHKIDFAEMTALITKMAATDPAFKVVLAESLSRKTVLTDEQIVMVASVAGDEKQPAGVRALAIKTLQKNISKIAAIEGAAAALSSAIAAPKLEGELKSVFDEFVRDTKLVQNISYFEKLSFDPSPARRELAHTVLLNLTGSKLVKKDAKVQAALVTIDKAWAKEETALPLLRAIARVKSEGYNQQVNTLMKDARPEVAKAAAITAKQLGLTTAAAADKVLIESMKYEDVLAAAQKEKGDAKLGGELFVKVGCIACHTVSSDETPKGPFLGGIATRYSRAELMESILKPSAKIAQGFETQWFKTVDDDDLDGFVTREAGNEVELRNAAGITTVLNKKDVKARGKRESSIMPNQLLDKQSAQDLANMLAYLESLKAK